MLVDWLLREKEMKKLRQLQFDSSFLKWKSRRALWISMFLTFFGSSIICIWSEAFSRSGLSIDACSQEHAVQEPHRKENDNSSQKAVQTCEEKNHVRVFHKDDSKFSFFSREHYLIKVIKAIKVICHFENSALFRAFRSAPRHDATVRRD